MLFSNWEVGVSSKVVMRKGAFSTCKLQEATGSLWQGGPPALLWYEASSLVPVEDSSLWWGKLLLRILCLFIRVLELMSSWDGELGIPLESLKGNQAISSIEERQLPYFSSSGRKWGFS